MKVFLSHSPEDADLARAIAAGLRREGLSVWLPSEEIFPGDNWAERISDALKECEAMVAVLTPETPPASNVAWDLDYALGNRAYRHRVIPVVVGGEAGEPVNAMPWILERYGVIRLTDPAEVSRAVHEIVGTLAAAA